MVAQSRYLNSKIRRSAGQCYSCNIELGLVIHYFVGQNRILTFQVLNLASNVCALYVSFQVLNSKKKPWGHSFIYKMFMQVKV